MGMDFEELGIGSRYQGPVVRKPINANPRLKVNRGFHLTR